MNQPWSYNTWYFFESKYYRATRSMDVEPLIQMGFKAEKYTKVEEEEISEE